MRIVEPIKAIYPQKDDILKYKNLILKCLKGIRVPSYTTIEDIKQQAWLGLCIAKDKFDYTKNCKFMTYAYYYVRGYINRMLYTNYSLLSYLGYETIKYHPETIPNFVPIIDYDEDEDTRNKIQLVSTDSTDKIDDKLDYYKLKRIYDKYSYVLTSKQKEAIEIFYFKLKDNGKAYKMKDIAEELNTSTSAISTRIRLGCQTLKRKIGNYLDVYI